MESILYQPDISRMKEHTLEDIAGILKKRISRRAFSADKKLSRDQELRILSENSQPGYFGEEHMMYILDSAKLLQEGKNINDTLFYNWISLVQHGGEHRIIKTIFKGLTYKLSGGKVFRQGERWIPPSYLVSFVKGGLKRNDPTIFGNYEVNYGYVGAAAEFYKKTLKAKEIGINSCIHGIITNKQVLYESIPCGNDWDIPMISPLGYSPEELTAWEEKIRDKHCANHKIAAEMISFDCYGKRKDPGEIPGNLFNTLNWIARGPSAGNNQPWRFYFEEGVMHMYVDLSGKKIYRERHLRELDAGIAMATVSMLEKKGTWKILKDIEINSSSSEIYIASFDMGA